MSTVTQPDGLEFRPVLDKDAMLDILANHARGLSPRDQRAVARSGPYQDWVGSVATKTFDYGAKIFRFTKLLQQGDYSAGTDLYLTYCSLLSELYRESFDFVDFLPNLPPNVAAFLKSPASWESLAVPETDFVVAPHLDFSQEERFFDERTKATLHVIAVLIARALSVKYKTCRGALTVRINTHIRTLARLAMELVSGYQMVLLYGVSQLAVANVREKLQKKFFDETGEWIFPYLGEGKMFADDRFESDQELKKVLEAMTGELFATLYIQ